MRIYHTYDSSFVFQTILDILYSGKILDVAAIAEEFDYDTSSIYKILKKIDYNLVLINPNIQLEKISPGQYKFNILK